MWVFLNRIAEKIEYKTILTDDHSPEQCCELAREFLRRNKFWMRDVLETYKRKLVKEGSARDNDIVEPKAEDFTDFRPIFLGDACLTGVAFTSEKAAKWTFQAMAYQALILKSLLWLFLNGKNICHRKRM